MTQEISMYRGTSCSRIIELLLENETPYTLVEGDKIIFTIKASPDRTRKIYLKKVLTQDDYNQNNELVISFNPEDTVDWQPYNYCYDVGIEFADGSFYIIIPPSPFKLLPDVSEKEGVINE